MTQNIKKTMEERFKENIDMQLIITLLKSIGIFFGKPDEHNSFETVIKQFIRSEIALHDQELRGQIEGKKIKWIKGVRLDQEEQWKHLVNAVLDDVLKYVAPPPKPMKSVEEIKLIYIGMNERGQFIVDEDTGKGKYTIEEKISQLQYKINELVTELNKVKQKVGDGE